MLKLVQDGFLRNKLIPLLDIPTKIVFISTSVTISKKIQNKPEIDHRKLSCLTNNLGYWKYFELLNLELLDNFCYNEESCIENGHIECLKLYDFNIPVREYMYTLMRNNSQDCIKFLHEKKGFIIEPYMYSICGDENNLDGIKF